MIDDELMSELCDALNQRHPESLNVRGWFVDTMGFDDNSWIWVDYIEKLRHENIAMPMHKSGGFDHVALMVPGREMMADGGWKPFSDKLKAKKMRADKDALNKSKLLQWQVCTFWIVLIFGAASAFYSAYDFFIETPSIEEQLQQLRQPTKETESELSTSHTSPSSQKTATPSLIPNSLTSHWNSNPSDSVSSKQSNPSDSVKLKN